MSMCAGPQTDDFPFLLLERKSRRGCKKKGKERAEMGFEGAETVIAQSVTDWHMAGWGQCHHGGLLGPDAPFWGVFFFNFPASFPLQSSQCAW